MLVTMEWHSASTPAFHCAPARRRPCEGGCFEYFAVQYFVLFLRLSEPSRGKILRPATCNSLAPSNSRQFASIRGPNLLPQPLRVFANSWRNAHQITRTGYFLNSASEVPISQFSNVAWEINKRSNGSL